MKNKTEEIAAEIDIKQVFSDKINPSESGEFVHGFSCDLSKSNKFSASHIGLYKNRIYYYNDDDRLSEYELSKVKNIKCLMLVGCVVIEFDYDGVKTEFCRGSFKMQNQFPDFAVQLDVYLKGEIDNVSDKSEKYTCPKCGQYYESGTEYCVKCTKKSKIFLRLLKLALPYKKTLIISLIMFIVTTLISMYVPTMERKLTDDYIFRDKGAVSASQINFVDILVIILAIVALQIIIRIISIIRSILMGNISNDLSFNLRSMVFNKIQEMSISKISKRTAGELINRVSNDTADINEFLTYGFPDVVQQLILFIGISIFIFMSEWKLALFIFIPLPLFFFSTTLVWNFLDRLFTKAWVLRSASSSVMHDVFSGIRVVKSYGTEKREMEKCGKAIKNLAEIDMKSEKFFSLFYPITNFLLHISSYLILFYIGSNIIGGHMTRGEMVQFNAYVSLIYGPLHYMTFLPRWMSYTMSITGKLFELIDEKIDLKIIKNPVSKKIEGTIDIKNMYFGYKDYDMVLKNVNLNVKPGEMIGIVGKSGVGKSTLINLLMRIYDSQKGTIEIDGVDIKDFDPNNLRSQIGVVLQETFLFSGTIYENIAYAKKNATYDEIIKAAKFANAHQFIMKLPDSYNTKVGEHGYTLSGGERQRIAIARAVLHDPRILILDEATSALDTETEALVQDSLQKLIKNRTTFAIAHRLSTLRNATRLIIIDKGTIAEVGTHDELMAKKGIYYSLVMAQRQMSKMSISKN